ncbi:MULTISPECIES: hypothetical protein [unclassified Microbacterium]|uniref:hypothetical protein n=1 Tax=unclassified Microbacterium TaxID=2609290 RepID=UPI0030196510
MNEDRTTLKISVTEGSSSEIGFEPIGTSFVVEGGDWLTLELPVSAMAGVEIVVWPNGVAVWVPLPGDYLVRDSSGNELDRL